LLSAAAATGRGILRCLGAAVLFYLPVALMCLYLGQAWAPYPNSGKAQWDSIFLWTSIVTFFAAVVVAFLPPIRISRDDNP
jgi:hypothetical protein